MTEKQIFVLYIVTHDENKSLMIVVLTWVALLSLKEHVVNVPEPFKMNTAPPHCSKMKERPKKETEELLIYKSICQHSMR